MIVFFVAAAFEISIIRMSRYFDLSQNAVLFGDTMLPMDAFMTTRNTEEMNLVTQIFDFAKSLAEMQLSEMVLGLYSAYILLQEGINMCSDGVSDAFGANSNLTIFLTQQIFPPNSMIFSLTQNARDYSKF